MSLLSKIANLGAEIRQATATVQDNIAELRAAITAKRDELTRATRAAAPPAEVIERFDRWVDEMAAYHHREYGTGLVTQRFGAAEGPRAPWGLREAVTWGELCAFAGEVVKANFAQVVRTTEYTPGPASKDRGAIVARLEAELGELETREEQLVDEAGAAGVVIAHRPEVLERRTTEARRRELAEQAAADRREREAAINQRHEAARGPVISQYLQANRRGLD